MATYPNAIIDVQCKKKTLMQFADTKLALISMCCAFAHADIGHYCLLTESMDIVVYVDKQRI